MKFYLNSVGYKVDIKPNASWKYFCFIWTLWDIKCFLCSCWGCSVKVSFIWTLWDIKISLAKERTNSYQGFIWTLWDIKSLLTVLNIGISIFKFYLNSVGYKGFCCFLCLSAWLQSFIWTLWDINAGRRTISIPQPGVLSELCGI